MTGDQFQRPDGQYFTSSTVANKIPQPKLHDPDHFESRHARYHFFQYCPQTPSGIYDSSGIAVQSCTIHHESAVAGSCNKTLQTVAFIHLRAHPNESRGRKASGLPPASTSSWPVKIAGLPDWATCRQAAESRPSDCRCIVYRDGHHRRLPSSERLPWPCQEPHGSSPMPQALATADQALRPCRVWLVRGHVRQAFASTTALCHRCQGA